MVVYLGKTRYNLDTNNQREALALINAFCEEHGYLYKSPLVVNKTTLHVDVVTTSGKHVTTCKIYDKRRNKKGNSSNTK
jgi:hypothetical protein